MFVLLFRILYGLIRSSTFMLNTAHHKIRPVNHISIAYLNSRLRVRICGLCTYLDFIIVVEVFFFVIPIFRFHVRQHQRKMRIAISIFTDSSLNCSRSKKVKDFEAQSLEI